MLSIRVNKTALIQTEMAAIYYSVLPVRVQYAQMQAMVKSKRDMKMATADLGRAAKYLQYEVIPFGQGGMTLRVKPYPKGSFRKDGGNIQIGSAILLTGKKGGGVIRPKRSSIMKTRPESVNNGYSEFYRAVRKVAIPSKRKEIREIAKQVILKNLKQEFIKQGFTARGAGGVDVVR
jgi:hypothetical protein